MKPLSKLSKVLIAGLVFTSAPLVILNTLSFMSAQAAVTRGYNWKTILPTPPVIGGQADLADMAAVKGYQSLVGTPRWGQATRDVSFDVFDIYGSDFGPVFTVEEKREYDALFKYASAQLAHASHAAKATYGRPRPFGTAPNLKLCTSYPPQDSSYPSGHAAWGRMTAQILAQLNPAANPEQFLARGYEYGDSRIICGVHYPSDVAAGRLMGDAVLAALEKDAKFQRLMHDARSAGR
jgi:acid phosphatase (class A)